MSDNFISEKNSEYINSIEHFGSLVVKIKVIKIKGVEWKYSISGKGSEFLLAILSNTTGHLLALPLAEEFSNKFTTIALSVPAIPVFSEIADCLAELLMHENIASCSVIGHSNGGVYLQSFIRKYPDIVDRIVFSHSLTSMQKQDAFTTNASEVKAYKTMRNLLKILPVSVLSFALGNIVIKKLVLQSGVKDTKRLKDLCKADLESLTKQTFLTMADCMDDFLFNHTFTDEPSRKSRIKC